MARARRVISLSIIALLTMAALIVMQDWRLWYRFLTQPDDVADPASAMWFSPLATVGEGDGAALRVAAEGERTLPNAALEAAWAYAESMGTDALIVAQNGVIQFERYADGVDERTLFQSQSLHKGLTATALGAAIHAGAIPSADTTAATWLTEWADASPADSATLADLAYMQAGLERPRYANHPFSRGLQLFLSGDVTERALSTPFVAQPGEVFIWSNASTQALSIAIERAVGQPWHEFLRESLWAPLGAGEAYVQLDRPDGTAFSACCLVTTPRSWLRVGQLLLDNGRIGERRVLPEGWVRAMTTGGRTNPNYGMQLWVNEPYEATILRNGLPRFAVPRGERLAATDAYYIEGHFAQRLHVVPSAGLVVVRLGDDRMDWDDAALMNGLIRAAQARRAAAPLPRIAPPRVSFDDEPKPPAPDYTTPGNWAAHPDTRDAADRRPGGEPAVPPTAPARAFFVAPTTYPGPDWNAAANDPAINPGVDAVVAGQASVLNGCCDVYAPRYRQASSPAVFDRTGSGMQAYGLAYTDVRRAFERFIAEADGAPFVLMGHSQGAFHIQRLISDVVVPQGLIDRLVVAYVIGIAVPEARFAGEWQGLEACADETQTGCVMSWSTYGPNARADMFQRLVAPRFPQYARADGGIDIVCTNPLTGSPADADAAVNLGAVPVPVPGAYLAEPIAEAVGARCDAGLLRLDRAPGPAFETLVMPGESYHFYDVALFYENLRADAVNRVAAFASAHD